MTRQVLFNGAVLVRAGGASKVDASAFQNVGLGGIGNVGLVGEATGGEPAAVVAFRTPAAMAAYYRSGALADAADLAFLPMNDTRVPGGANLVLAYKANAGTQSTYTFLDGTDDSFIVTSRDWGEHTKKINVDIDVSGTGRIVTINFEDGANSYVETSPVLGGTAEFTLVYTGAGTAATCDITATTLETTVTGASGEDLVLNFSTYTTLQELINELNVAAGGVYTAAAVTTNPFAFECSNLDRLTGVDIKTAAAGFLAVLYRMVEWTNANSSWVTAARATGTPDGDQPPDATASAVSLAGGTRGVSTNTNWQDGFDALGTVRANQVVPLCSEDLTNEGFGSTATFASVAASADSHAAYYSSTKGKSERQAWLGIKGNKAAIIAQAGSLQSPHTVLTAQQVTRKNAANDLVVFPEWGLAVIAAGGRAGSLLGEPLVYKNIRASGLTQDASWNPLDDGDDMILAGVTFAFAPPNQGYKFDRVVTTYTKLDNDAYVEESVVQGWKNVTYELRTQLENIFTGTRALPTTITGIKDAVERILETFRQEGQIVDSQLEDGTVLKAYRDIHITVSGDIGSISVTISPVSGINFQLHTLFLVPAVIAA